MGYTAEGWQWEFPAHVVAVLDGASFVANVDLGFHVRVQVVVLVADIRADVVGTHEGMLARKEAQRLLKDADVVLTECVLTSFDGQPAVFATVAYAPWHVPRSEQGSFAAAMLAAGHVQRAA